MFTLSSHWLHVTFTFVLIGCCVYFGFGFTTLNQKHTIVIVSLETNQVILGSLYYFVAVSFISKLSMCIIYLTPAYQTHSLHLSLNGIL